MAMVSQRGKSNSILSALAQFVIISAASTLLAVIIFIICLTNQAQNISQQKGHLSTILTVNVSTTLTLVSALQGLLTSVVTVALSRAFSYIQWGAVGNNSRGASYISALATSPTTSVWGTIRLIAHWSSTQPARLWALCRLLLMLMVWLGGVVLFFRTSLVIAFDTAHTYTVTAGVGPFNASYVDPFFKNLKSLAPSYQFNVLPYSYYGQIHDLITNSFFTTTADTLWCRPDGQDETAHCAAYLLSGGVVGATPWIPNGFSDHPQVLIENAPMVHVEFDAVPAAPRSFDESTCQVFGSNMTRIAVEFCLAQLGPAKLEAGIFVCTGGISSDGKCHTTTKASPNITTTFSFYQRRGNILSAKSNLTIVEVTNLTQAQPIPLSTTDVGAYRAVLAWLLDYSAADIPGPSSIIENFWSAGEQLQHSYSNAILQRNFRSILVFPLWLFNANNYGNAGLEERIVQNDLPPEFYTTASLVRPYTKLKFNLVMVFVFVAFEGLALLFAWLVLAWVVSTNRSLPEISSFPLFDAEFKAKAKEHAINENDCEEVWRCGDSQILEAMSVARLERKL